MSRTYVQARSKRRKDGSYSFQCGHATCLAPIGEARPPRPRQGPGISIQHLDPKNPPGASVETDWILHAPKNRNVSAADGFARMRDAEGNIVYAVVSPKPERNSAGQIMVDGEGRPIMRQGGRRRSPRWATLYDEAHGLAERKVHGHLAALPAIVRCGVCHECSTVVAPDD